MSLNDGPGGQGERGPGRHGGTAIALHWVSAVLLAGIFGLAWRLEDAGEEAHAALLGWHRALGLALLAVTVARLANRALSSGRAPSSGRPEGNADPPWMRLAAASVHVALYALLLAQPLLGWALSGARGQAVGLAGLVLPALADPDRPLARTLFAWHGWAGIALLALAGLHVLAALAHAARPGDRTLAGMLPGPGFLRRARSARSCSRPDPRRRR